MRGEMHYRQRSQDRRRVVLLLELWAMTWKNLRLASLTHLVLPRQTPFGSMRMVMRLSKAIISA